MLAVPADRLPGALGDLDPGNRALLDLSLRRGVSDAEIGELLRKEPAEVARGRDAVLELLADALDVAGHDRRDRVRDAITALPDDAWRTRSAAPPPSEPAEPPEAEPVPPPEPPKPPPAEADREQDDKPPRGLDDDFYFSPEEPRRSRRSGMLALVLLLGVLVALGVVLLAGGDDDDEDPSRPADTSSGPGQDGDGAAPAGRAGRLTTLGSGRSRGRVEITDEGATIELRGLPDPDGTYQVWLYDNVVDAQSLGTISGGDGRLEVQLPPDARSYRFLDVSQEPADGNPNHSGESVLRTQLRALLRD